MIKKKKKTVKGVENSQADQNLQEVKNENFFKTMFAKMRRNA